MPESGTVVLQWMADHAAVVLLTVAVLVALGGGAAWLQTVRRRRGWDRVVWRLGEESGRHQVIHDVRVIEHAFLKPAVWSIRRCLIQARTTSGAAQAAWIEDALHQTDHLLDQVQRLYQAKTDAHALPDDIERALVDLMRNYTLAYPDVEGSVLVNGDRVETPDPEIARHVLTVAANALANAYRHAHADQVQVFIGYAPEHWTVMVTDTGQGLPAGDEGQTPGQGLRDMRQSIERIGGRMQIASIPQRGTQVSVTAPYHRLEVDAMDAPRSAIDRAPVRPVWTDPRGRTVNAR